jgi:hypothetical protein
MLPSVTSPCETLTITQPSPLKARLQNDLRQAVYADYSVILLKSGTAKEFGKTGFFVMRPPTCVRAILTGN